MFRISINFIKLLLFRELRYVREEENYRELDLREFN
jgi:hypothetical protein